MDRFRHKLCRLGRGLKARDGRRIRLGTHVHDRNRRGGLNVSRGVDAVHGSLQMDIHEHDIWVTGEGVLNRLQAAIGHSHDLIAEAAEPATSNAAIASSSARTMRAGGSIALPSGGYARPRQTHRRA